MSFPWKLLWHSKVLSRVTFFSWTAALEKILFTNKLWKKGIIVLDRCCVCKKCGNLDQLLLFFFLTGNQKFIIKERERKKKKMETKLREDINSEREEQSVKPQQRDHSKRLRWHKTFNLSNVFSLSSKEQRFRSNHTIHIKHPGTKFQMSELCFPSH